MSYRRAHSTKFFCVRNLRSILIFSPLLSVCCSYAAAQNWGTPVWSDEFNGAANSPISAANWTYDTGILNVNNEAEYYCQPTDTANGCNPATPNAYIDGNGHLVIQAIQVSSSVAPYSGSWTSARLKSQGLQSFQYGRIESSMSLPLGPGIWPAFWALGTDITSVSWPASGEMDFMENVPVLGPVVIASTLHGGTSSNNCYCGGHGLSKSYTINDGTTVSAFHTYGAIWSPNMVQFYVDDPTKVFFVRTASDVPSGLTWDFNAQFFLLLNLAVGGTNSWPGPTDNTTPNPAIMTVDYVRAYTPSAIPSPTLSASAITVAEGKTGSTTANVTSASGNGRMYFSCTTTAPKATCSVSSSDALNPYTIDFSNTSSASLTVIVATTANTAASLPAHPVRWIVALSSFFVGIALLMPTDVRRKPGLATLGLMILLAAMLGCGGGSSSAGGGGTGGNNGTAPGNYSVTVNAYTVSNASGNPDSTTSISLTVN
jgi:beta-glucanase (GH16 family)